MTMFLLRKNNSHTEIAEDRERAEKRKDNKEVQS
jgi:hypothetical protein